MGPTVQNLLQVATSTQISCRARCLWISMAASPDRWVRQATLAEIFKCSKSTIGRTLRELKQAGLIIDTGKRHLGRFKIYEIGVVTPAVSQVEPEMTIEQLKVLTEHQQLMKEHGARWRNTYGYALDGKNRRPTIEFVVELALISLYRKNYCTDLLTWVEDWIKTNASRYGQLMAAEMLGTSM